MDESSTSGRKKTGPSGDIHLQVRWTGNPVLKRGLNKLVKAVLSGEGRPGVSVGFLFTGDAELRTMNRTWRDKDRVTDVLSFPADPGSDPGPDDGYLGDIAISLDRARAQALRFSVTFEEETARLIVHGLLHLLGHDHHTPADGRRMKARERIYLAGVDGGSLIRPC